MSRFPSLFISHGAPTFAVEPDLLGPKLGALGRSLRQPEAVLVISAHWLSDRPRLTAAPRPTTLHDFAGFGAELERLQYPAPGHPEVAEAARERLRQAGWPAETDAERGLDHGVWVPLRHLYPDAQVPVVQLAMPKAFDAAQAFELGRALAPLAQSGVLIVGSGGLTHNLADLGLPRAQSGYVDAFAAWVRESVLSGDSQRLAHALDRAPHARRAHPSHEHFWPLLVAAGGAAEWPPVTVI